MIIDQAGTYRLLEDLTLRGETNTPATFKSGMLLTISHIDLVKKQVLGPAIPGWQFWELPVEPYTEEMEIADSIKRGEEYFAGTGKAYSQEQLDQLLGMSDIEGINREKLVKFFDHWKTQFFTKDQDTYPREWAKEAADFFIEFFIKPTTIDGKL